MNRITTALVLLLLLASLGSGQHVARPFTEAKGLPGVNDSSHFKFSTARFKYEVSKEGRGKRTGGDVPASNFNLRLESNVYLDRAIYHAEYEGDLLLICEVSDGDYGSGFITRLDGRTLRMKWKRIIPAFNVGQGLIEDQYAYVTGIGFIGKVNLESGAFLWQHNDLYRRHKHAFNSFELPEIRGNRVIFRESKDDYREKVATIRVEKRSGRIIRLDV
jgi:hypothetical protein